jgi:hypothetical protein
MNLDAVRAAFYEELNKIGADLAGSAQKSEVYRDVAKKYPKIAAPAKGKEKDSNMGGPTAPESYNAMPLPKSFSAPSIGGAGMGKAGASSEFGRFLEGARGEIGPALGATLGAGFVKMKGGDPLSGAALGYGVGSLPELLHSRLHKKPGA